MLVKNLGSPKHGGYVGRVGEQAHAHAPTETQLDTVELSTRANPLSDQDRDKLKSLDLRDRKSKTFMRKLLSQQVGENLEAFIDLHLPKDKHSVAFNDDHQYSAFELVRNKEAQGSLGSLRDALLGPWNSEELEQWSPQNQELTASDIEKLQGLSAQKKFSGGDRKAVRLAVMKSQGYGLSEWVSNEFPQVKNRLPQGKSVEMTSYELVSEMNSRGQLGSLLQSLLSKGS